jgi:hypothetical protein
MTTSMGRRSGNFGHGGVLDHHYFGGACIHHGVLYYDSCMDYEEGEEALGILMWTLCQVCVRLDRDEVLPEIPEGIGGCLELLVWLLQDS